MISDMETLFESTNKELTIKGDDREYNILLIIVLNVRKFSFNKYPESIVTTLEDFTRGKSLEEYFYLDDYTGFIRRTPNGYRIHLEMVNTDLAEDDLSGFTQTIRNYFQVQSD